MYASNAGMLRDLLGDVMLARTALTAVRRQHAPTHLELDSARHRLVQALRAYSLGLDAKGMPMPYRLRDELRMHERLTTPEF